MKAMMIYNCVVSAGRSRNPVSDVEIMFSIV